MARVLLDLFCGAGGAAQGYHEAGFEVIGADIAPQPRYPFAFIQADALETLKAVISGEIGVDAIHASPPCQAYSIGTIRHRMEGREYPRLVEATRFLLRRTALPYLIENVQGAPLKDPVTLCGSHFGLVHGNLYLKRHRLFEANWPLPDPGEHDHSLQAVPVTGHGVPSWVRRRTGPVPIEVRRRLMGIAWMNQNELGEAIPPAYTRYIGEHLMNYLENGEAA